MQSSALRHKHLLFAICRKAHSTVFRKQCSSRFLGQNFRLYIFKRNYGSQPSNSVNRSNWTSVVGLEVHAQINTSTKLFSGSSAKFGAPANSLVSLFDCAIPGTLPVLNKKCVEAGVLTALALNCRVNLTSEFDRKHYFYADLPTGYQITQQRLPLASDGYLTFAMLGHGKSKEPQQKKSVIKQLQLEQDSGKSLHDDTISASLIDLNRAGVALMEIVFEPDLSDGEEAAALVAELIGILEALDTCNCKMEEGSLRVDANVSVNKVGEKELGTRTEIKNLNSLRAVARAIDYEISRQIQVLEQGGTVTNETLGFDSQLKKTLSMRDKEAKQDYRYMPEPNLPPLRLQELGITPSDYRSRIPTLPDEERRLLMEKYQLSLETAVQIVNGGNLKYFQQVMEARPHLAVKRVTSLLLTDLLGLLNKDDIPIQECPVSPEKFAEIVELRQNGVVAHAASQSILALLYKGDLRSPSQIVEQEGWAIITDVKQIEKICRELIAKHEKEAAAYRSGKTKGFSKLASQLQRTNSNNLDMAVAIQVLKKILEE